MKFTPRTRRALILPCLLLLSASTLAWPNWITKATEILFAPITYSRTVSSAPVVPSGVSLDFGDAPTAAQSGFPSSYPTLQADDGAIHTASGLALGSAPDGEGDGQPNANATGDGADEDGVTFGTFTAGSTATLNITTNGGVGVVNAWVDFNRDGDWSDAGEQVITNSGFPIGLHPVNISIPAGASPGNSFMRVRLTSSEVTNPLPTGQLSSGEVEDYQVTIVSDAVDFGDAPTAAQSGFPSSYPTTLAQNGARHIASGLTLGATRDNETDGQPNSTATGDGADEDGVTFGAFTVGTTATLNVTVAGDVAGLVHAWIDFNRDGDWSDAGEKVLNNFVVFAGANSLNVAIPAGASVGNSFMRVRLTRATLLDSQIVPTGEFPTGEVEDYQVSIVEAPCMLICPANITVSADEDCSVPVTFPAPTTTGSCGTVTTSHASGSSFRVGTTTVTSVANNSCNLIYGLLSENQLISFNPSTPGTTSSPVAITGLSAGERVEGIDFRPANGQLYGVVTNTGGSTLRLVTINPTTGAITASIGMPFAKGGGSFVGFDFNPVADRARVVTDNGSNLRINPDDGTVTTDAALNPGTPRIVAAAYTNNLPGAATTTLFGLDRITDALVIQNPPNNGTLVAVGALGVDIEGNSHFDISQCGTPYAALQVGVSTGLYTIDLTTGAATFVGAIGSGATLRGMAVAPAATSCSFTVTVNDTTPPILTAPADTSYQCLADVPPLNTVIVAATDNCSGVTRKSEETSSGTCPITIRRTFTVTDAAGNSASAVQTITVNDTIPPVLAGVPANLMVNSLAEVPLPANVTATDNCGPIVPTFTQTSSGTCPSTITRTWTATDACGNSASATQTIEVKNSQPSITDPVNVNLLQGGTATFTVTATGSPAPLIQWFVSTDGGANFAPIPGATNATLTIPNVTPALNNNRYRAVASNECGTATSRAAVLNVSAYEIKFADPLVCLAGGDLVTVNAFITNNGPDAINTTYSVTNLAPNLIGIPGSGIASVSPANFVITATAANWNGVLQPGQTVNFTFKAQLAANVGQGAQVCVRSSAAINGGTPVVLNPCTIIGCPPGGINPTVSSQKPGSLLIFPYHTSKSATKSDTRITITNAGAQFAYVHLFFIDGVTCQQSDMFLCLTPNASFSGRASEFDPETTGWILAVAVNQQGVPIQLNQLIGNAFVTDGDYVDTYGAETFAARSPQVAAVQDNTALLFLDGIGYDAVANQFAVEVQSPVTAPNQRIVTVGLRGDLNTSTMRGAAQVGTGLVINGNEQPMGSFTGWLNGNCQAISPITNASPRVPLGMNGMIPAGQVGTMQFRITAGVGLLMTPRTAAWSGIRPLHKTGLTTATIRIPIFVPVC